jgi:geranylgeranyl reductase family protein
MKDIDAEVIIIGAGPAGSTAAQVLGSAGISTLLLDRAQFPRRKPCGGGLPSGVEQLFDFEVPEPDHVAPHHRRYFDFGREATIRDRQPLMMVDRQEFDNQLLEQAIAHPTVEFRGGTNIREVSASEDDVRVATRDGEELRARYLIGADGANSIVARSLGLVSDDKPAVALDIEIRVPDVIYEQHKDYATFHFGVIDAGYAWIFPKNDVLSCGIGSWTGEAKLQQQLDDFLERAFPGVDYEVLYRAGQALPLYSTARKSTGPRTLLVGDAAGMVDPVFGEGIRYAMLSGRFAAESIIASNNDDPDDLATKRYEAAAKKHWGERFRKQRALAFKDLVEAPDFFYRTFIEKGFNYDQWYSALFSRDGDE